jgi:ElaB/YqjD/DUF883 family membrane-anchored ribosome-binding protein
MMESAMDYVRDTTNRTTEQCGAKLRSVAGQVTEKIKQYPMSAAAIGAGLGSVSARRMVPSREGLRSTADRMSENIRQHPLQSALVGAGLLWLAFGGRARANQGARYRYASRIRDDGTSCDYGETYAEPVGRAREGSHVAENVKRSLRDAGESARETARTVSGKIGELGGSVGNATSQIGSRASESVREVWHRAASGSQRMTERAKEFGGQAQEKISHGYQLSRDELAHEIDERPLAVAAAALGLGLLAGFLLPRTRAEDRLMGEASDHLKEQARDVAERGKEVVQATGQVAMGQLQEQVKDLAQDALDRGKEVAQATRQAALHEAQQHGLNVDRLSQYSEPKGEKHGSMHSQHSDAAAAVGKQVSLQEAEAHRLATESTSQQSCDVGAKQQSPTNSGRGGEYQP